MEGSRVRPMDVSESRLDTVESTTSGRSEREEISEKTKMIASTMENTNYAQGQGMRRRVWWSSIFLPLSVLFPLGVLIWWIVTTAENRPHMLSAQKIGGELTYIQAKAIDFICGATLAPLLMILFDYLWFSNARVVVVNERPNSKAVPLSSLVAVSQSSAGSFNLLRVKTLLEGKTWRLGLLSLLILTSGFSATMLQNFIAYEAFTLNIRDSQPVTLRSLQNPTVDTSNTAYGGALALLDSLPTSQASDLANQITGLLTGLTFESAQNKLEDGMAYIGTNATMASLNALNSSIVGLTDVHGYRLSIDCQPGSAYAFSALQQGEMSFEFTLITNGTTYWAQMPGIMGINDPASNNEIYEYVGFDTFNTHAFLGYLYSFNGTNTTYSSEYGKVHGQAWNMTPWHFTGTKAVMSTWDISCNISRQEGLLNYTRQANSTNWEITSSTFSDKKVLVPSFLGSWQTVLNYQAPYSSIPGIGPAIAETAWKDEKLNWTMYALNYLYASGEVERILYEVTTANDTTKGNTTTNAAFFYDVHSTRSVEKYRITYIPLLLLLGLLGVTGAASIAAGLMFSHRDTASGRMGREVNPVRLLLDSVVGLQDSSSVKAAAGIISTSELDDWAKECRVGYSTVVEENGDVMIRLIRSQSGKVTDDSS